jgi:hypothetical protein
LLNRGEQTLRVVTGSGGRLHFGMVAGIKSERRPTSNRNPRPDCVGIRKQYEQALVPAAIGGDEKAIATAVRVQERKATLLGSNPPLRGDPIALATEVAWPLTSTEQLKKVWDDFMAMDKRALRNGGPGYGDWRDDRDREEMARALAMVLRGVGHVEEGTKRATRR